MKKTLFLIIILLFPLGVNRLFRDIPSEDFYRWECVYWAIASVESEFNNSALGTKGDGGVIQIMPKGSGGFLDEANRLLGVDKFFDKDRFCPVKSREIWDVVMKFRNPQKSLLRAIKLHNPKAGKWYADRVFNKYNQFIKTIK